MYVQGLDVDSEFDGMSPIALAAALGEYEIVKLLVFAGASIHNLDPESKAKIVAARCHM